MHIIFFSFCTVFCSKHFEFLCTNEIEIKQTFSSVICSRDLPLVCANKVSVVRCKIHSTSSFNNKFVSYQQDPCYPELYFSSPAFWKETRVLNPASLQGKLQCSIWELVVLCGKIGGGMKMQDRGKCGTIVQIENGSWFISDFLLQE